MRQCLSVMERGKKEKKPLRFSMFPEHSFAMSRFPSLPEARRAQFLVVIRGRVRAGCSCGGTAARVGKLFPGRKQAALPAPEFLSMGSSHCWLAAFPRHHATAKGPDLHPHHARQKGAGALYRDILIRILEIYFSCSQADLFA